jgi:hypothetical protein
MAEIATLRAQSVAEAVPIDYEAVAKAIGLNPRDPLAQAVQLICRRYGLDPALGHVSIYKGKVYIHLIAYIHLANQQPAYDGYEIAREWEDDTYCHAEVRVHRSDRKFPAARTGKSAKNKPKKDGRGTYEDFDADAKAFAQAFRRALRMAFNVEWPEPEEERLSTEEAPPPEPVMQVARIVKAAEAGASPETGEVLDGDGWPPEQEQPGRDGGGDAPTEPASPTMPDHDAIDGLRDPGQARQLTADAPPEFQDALKATVGYDRWKRFWGHAPLSEWQDKLHAALRGMPNQSGSGAGTSAPPGASPTQGEPEPGPTPGGRGTAVVDGAAAPGQGPMAAGAAPTGRGAGMAAPRGAPATGHDQGDQPEQPTLGGAG